MLNTTLLFLRMLAERYFAFTSAGLDQDAAFASAYHALSCCSESGRAFQCSLNAFLEIIHTMTVPCYWNCVNAIVPILGIMSILHFKLLDELAKKCFVGLPVWDI